MTHRTGRVRTIQPLLALLLGAVATAGLLLATRPAPAPAPAWSGDDLAIALLWWGAVIASVWLAITTLACVTALARDRTRSAHRIARFAPPLARRALVAALISTWALVPTAAFAAPSYRGLSHADHTYGDSSDTGGTAPMTVHADARGRLTIDTPPDRPAPMHPAASAPTTTAATTGTTTTTTPVPAPATPTTTPTPTPTVAPITFSPALRPRTSPAAPIARSTAPVPTATPVAPRVGARTHVVVAGDNLWSIARTEVARVAGTEPVTDALVAPYWQLLITANRATLRSGDPSVIFPGEVVALP